MKNKIIITALILALSPQVTFAQANSLIAGNNQELADYKANKGKSLSINSSKSRYLGQKEIGDAESQIPKFPKVNLLEESVIEKNPHFGNESFWAEDDSSKFIKTDVVNKDLADTLYDMMKGASESPMSHTNMGMNLSPESEKGKNFVPPKTALVGNDHHHNYSDIESQYSGSYNPYKFYGTIAGTKVSYKIEDKKWVLDGSGRSLLSSNLTIDSPEGISYLDHADDIVVDIASYFFESLSLISRENLKISRINDNPEELLTGELDYVLRDICVSHLQTKDSMLIRVKVNSMGHNTESANVFSGVKCGV